MKIGFDAKRVFFNETGLGNYSRNLLRGLKESFNEHDYYLYTPPVPGKPLPQKRLKEFGDFIIKTPQTFGGKLCPGLWRSRGIIFDLVSAKIDLYHGLSHELPLGIEKTGIISVVTVHDLIFLRHPELYKSWDARIYKKKYSQSIYRADSIIAISENTRRDLIELLGVDPARIELIYQCADPLFYQPGSPGELKAVHQKYHISSPYFFYVGSLNERKNLLRLIDAYAILAGQNDLPELLLAGSGLSYRKKMEEKIAGYGLGAKIRFLGAVPTEDLPALYQGASIFLYPSIYEGFGIPVIESLFSKTPVICSNESCFRETAGDGALFVDVKEPAEIAKAIDTLLKNPETAAEYAHRGHSYVQKFHQKRCSAEMESFYRRLYEQKKGSSIG